MVLWRVETTWDNIVKQMLACVRGLVEPGGLLTSLWSSWSTGVVRRGLTGISDGSEFDNLLVWNLLIVVSEC